MSVRSARRTARSLDDKEKTPPKQIAPVAPGSYDSAAIILLTDGRRTTGVDTLEAAKMAADRGVRIYVVGLGTPDGHTAVGYGMAIYLQLDEPTLRDVARITGGEYHHAGTAEALRGVSEARLAPAGETRDTELTALLALPRRCCSWRARRCRCCGSGALRDCPTELVSKQCCCDLIRANKVCRTFT